jgi:mevalonate kinase
VVALNSGGVVSAKLAGKGGGGGVVCELSGLDNMRMDSMRSEEEEKEVEPDYSTYYGLV